MPTKWEITKAVRASELPAPSRLVMFVLADVAAVGTAEIPEKFTPSLGVLAKETGLDRRTVTRHLADLEDAGWVIRMRPEPEAQIRGERTRYRLGIPGAETACSDLEVEDPQEPAPRGTEPPEVGAQSPQARGTQPLLNKEVRSSSDQSDLFGTPPPASSPDSDAPLENTGTILAGFIDYCAARGVNIKSLSGQYAKTIKEALDADYDPRFIKNVLAEMLTDKIANRPSLLRNRLVEAQTGPEERRNGQHKPYTNKRDPDARAESWNRRSNANR